MNSDLISRSALLEKAIEEKRFVFRAEDLLREEVIFQTVYKDLASFILSAPAVDAVEVVRCRDCKHFDHSRMECQCDAVVTDNEGGASFTLNFYLDDFCSYGERRADDADLQ